MLISVRNFSIRIFRSQNRRISKIYPTKLLDDFKRALLDSQRTITVNLIAHISKKKIHNFQINSLCTIFCNFVKESTYQILSNFQSSTFNEDISVNNVDSRSKII